MIDRPVAQMTARATGSEEMVLDRGERIGIMTGTNIRNAETNDFTDRARETSNDVETEVGLEKGVESDEKTLIEMGAAKGAEMVYVVGVIIIDGVIETDVIASGQEAKTGIVHAEVSFPYRYFTRSLR